MIDIWIAVVAMGAWVVGFVSGFFALAWIAAMGLGGAHDAND